MKRSEAVQYFSSDQSWPQEVKSFFGVDANFLQEIFACYFLDRELNRFNIVLPTWTARLSGDEPLLTRETAQTAQASVKFDNTKLLKFFPDFRYTPIDQSIADTCTEIAKRLPPGTDRAI